MLLGALITKPRSSSILLCYIFWIMRKFIRLHLIYALVEHCDQSFQKFHCFYSNILYPTFQCAKSTIFAKIQFYNFYTMRVIISIYWLNKNRYIYKYVIYNDPIKYSLPSSSFGCKLSLLLSCSFCVYQSGQIQPMKKYFHEWNMKCIPYPCLLLYFHFELCQI